jgi:hypothetical protein
VVRRARLNRPRSTRYIEHLDSRVALAAGNVDTGCQGDEGVVDFRAALPADGEAFEVVEQGEGLLDDVVELAHTLDVLDALGGDDGQDSAFAQLFAVGAGVVALMGHEAGHRRSLPEPLSSVRRARSSLHDGPTTMRNLVSGAVG